MDVIPWAIGLVAGVAFPFRYAAAAGATASIVLRAYQYFLTDPRMWGRDFPEDLFGATAMIAVSVVFAWAGSIVRARRLQRAEVTS